MKRLLLASCLLFPSSLMGQMPVSASGSALVRYGDGKESLGAYSQKKEYFESLADVRVGISDFAIGFRLLIDAPPEYGVEYTGISKRFIEFTKEDLSLRAGTAFALLGRGLSMNLFESRALGFDNGIDGVKATYSFWKVRLGVVGGDIAYRDILDLNRVEKYRIRAGSVLFSPIQEVSVGFNFVSGTYAVEPPAFPDLTYRFDLPEVLAELHWAGIDLYGAYAAKRTSTAPGMPDPARGTGATGSVSYVGDAFGATIEYKDYRFGIVDPYRRTDPNRPDRAFAFQHPPIVHREHTATLMSRFPHVVDFNDEVGFQLDIFATFFERLTCALNGAIASRHYRWTPTGDSTAEGLPIYGRMDREGAFLPSLSAELSPFWEIYAEMQYFLNDEGTDYALVALNRRRSVTADEANYTVQGGPALSETWLWDVPVMLQMTVSSGLSLQAGAEQQWVQEIVGAGGSDYQNQSYALRVSYQPGLTVGLRYETTTSPTTPDGRTEWFALDVGYRVASSHTVGLTVGTERGGAVCSNGVCRIVSPFHGVRASLVSYF